ncbi:MAG TPA: crossover junction endodeoxyribonuclease RuvC [Bacteroidales bacterium]|nr:crossover junction endodeoxyribonuclease RuvC [Bacteroidales bacterium]
MSKDRIILGIDPGTNIMGYGIIIEKNNSIELMLMDVLILTKIKVQALKLKKIFESTLFLIDNYKPDELSIEAPFFGKNVQSMLKLGRAQGVAMAAALYREIPIFEYSPRKIKQSVTGRGNASKEQLAAMITNIFNFKIKTKYLDASDAVAVALCHYFQSTNNSKKNNYNSWKSYLTKNPNRII